MSVGDIFPLPHNGMIHTVSKWYTTSTTAINKVLFQEAPPLKLKNRRPNTSRNTKGSASRISVNSSWPMVFRITSIKPKP